MLTTTCSGSTKQTAVNDLQQPANGTDPEGLLVGTVTATNGKTIFLMEQYDVDSRIASIAAYTRGEKGCVEEKVFKVKNGYQSVIESTRINFWCSTNPDETFFAFNSADNTLYVPLIEEGEGYDRYLVYQFDGEHFIYHRKDVGYWLHPSLKSFEAPYLVGKTKDYLIRLDYLDDFSILRYAAWKQKDNTKDMPDLVIEDDGRGYDEFDFTNHLDLEIAEVFENEGYYYVVKPKFYIDEPSELVVFKGKKQILRQEMEILHICK